MSNYITPSLKRALRGKTLKPITEDYTMKEVNSMITALLGKPGVSAGKAQRSLDSQIASGNSQSAYGAAQMDVQTEQTKFGGSSSGTGLAAGIGLLRDIIGYYYADKAAQTAYNKQEEFYNNHMSMPAKVQEYIEAGLNPMGLAGVGAGATSAPSVQSASSPGVDSLTSLLGGLLSYKAQMARVEVDKERVSAYRESVASQVALREEQRVTQQKINDWYDTNQVANLDRVESETAKNLELAKTEEQKQALIFNQAIAQAIKNQYADEWERNSLALQEAELRYKESATAENYASVRVLSQKLQNMVLDAAYTVSKTENMQACTSYLGIKTDMLKFDKEHQRADKVWQRIGQAVGAVEGVTRSAANVFSCFSHIPVPPAASPSSRPRPVSADEVSGYDLVDVYAGAY